MHIQHVTIHTAKFEEEISFFETFTGLKIITDMREFRDMVFLADEEGATQVEIIGEDAPPISCPSFSIGFQTHHLEKIHDMLCAAGFTPTPFISPAPVVRFFFVNAPSGMKVQFIENVSK